jgi:hypothetical protein
MWFWAKTLKTKKKPEGKLSNIETKRHLVKITALVQRFKKKVPATFKHDKIARGLLLTY